MKERLSLLFPSNTRLIAVAEIFAGTSDFVATGIVSSIYFREGGNGVIKFIQEPTNDPIGDFTGFIRNCYEVGIPIPVILTAIVVVSAALIVDGFRRWEKTSQKS